MSVSFLTRLQVSASACNFIKKETLAQVFSWEFCEISKKTFFTEHLRVTTCAACYLPWLFTNSLWLL